MKRFLVHHYDATGYSSPGSEAAFNALETTYSVASKLLRIQYENDMSETISNYYTTPTSTLLVMTGGLVITTPGTYTFKLTTNGVCDLFINDVFVSASYINSGVGTYYSNGGILDIKVRFVGASASGYFNTTWKQPGQADYSVIPEKYLPYYGSTLFPFEVFDQVQEDLKRDYKVLGGIHQKQQIYTTSEPFKSFQITLKQNSVQERVAVKAWFDSIKGKLKTFMLNSRKSEFSLAEPIVPGVTSIIVKKAYTNIAYSYVKKILFFPANSFACQVIDVGEYIHPTYGSCEELFLSDPIPELPAGTCEINFLYFCRLDTDTLTFSLEDINFSSVKFSLLELYNDNYLTNLQ